MLARRYEMPWRTAYEAYAAAAWFAAAVHFCGVGVLGHLPPTLALPLALLCLSLSVWRLSQAPMPG
jgi:conjugal transfer pilus assembly protein TraD